MNIAIIVRRLDVKGGTQRQALSLARELMRRGDRVRLYTFSYNKERCYGDLLEDIPVTALDPESHTPRGVYLYLGKVSGLFYENGLARTLAHLIEPDTDILNPHDTVSYRVAYYFKRRVRNIPSVWQMNDLPSAVWALKRTTAFDSSFRPRWSSKLTAHFRDWLDRVRYIRAQNAISVLDRFNQALVKTYFDRDAVIIRSGLDLELFPYRPRALRTGKRIELLATGILFPHRRFEDAIRAVKIVADRFGGDPRLTIIGSAAGAKRYFERLADLVKREGLEGRVMFSGEVSDDELVRAYQTCDAFLFPNDLQTWGLAVFEAMAAGAPVIVSRGAGAHEVLTDRETALLVSPRDPEAIAGAIKLLIEDPTFATRLSQAANRFVRDHISWSRYTDGMLALFERVRTMRP